MTRKVIRIVSCMFVGALEVWQIIFIALGGVSAVVVSAAIVVSCYKRRSHGKSHGFALLNNEPASSAIDFDSQNRV